MRSYKEVFDLLHKEVAKVVIGQEEMIQQVFIAILCNGNALLEGYPGLAKTLAINTISEILDLSFARIQGTPDLMPSDITGTSIIEEDRGKRVFKFQKGPIFNNIVLADEINRATPKTQSALLEAMQEKQVSVGNQIQKLDLPFFVLATQNPIEQEGTYPLPEAQLDRFLLKIKVKYPNEKQELEIVDRFTGNARRATPRKVLNKERVFFLQNKVLEMPIANDLKQKAVNLILLTRNSKNLMLTRNSKNLIEYGASPRASLALIMTSKARALMMGRNHVSSEDIITMAYPVLRHRIIMNFEAERKGMTTDDAVTELIKKLK
ncbi:MoxR family ATPase [Candidatus Woesearchaeota archaeon]|nr:MoxR family ATPase [Candidatus Woesearchaeota archaeon]